MTPKTLTAASAGRTLPAQAGLRVNPVGQHQSESTRNEWPRPSEITRRLKAVYEFLQPCEPDPRVCNPELLKLSPDEKEYLIRVECVGISLPFKRGWERKRPSPAQDVRKIENELAETKLCSVRRQSFLRDPDRVLSEKQCKVLRGKLEAVEEKRKKLEVKLQAARNFERSSRRVDPKTGEWVKNRKYARYSFPLPKELLLLSCQRLLAVFGRPHQGRALLRFALVVIGLVRPTGEPAGFSETELERSWKGLRSMQRNLDRPGAVRRRKRGSEKRSRLPLWRCVLGPSFLTDPNVLLR